MESTQCSDSDRSLRVRWLRIPTLAGETFRGRGESSDIVQARAISARGRGCSRIQTKIVQNYILSLNPLLVYVLASFWAGLDTNCDSSFALSVHLVPFLQFVFRKPISLENKNKKEAMESFIWAFLVANSVLHPKNLEDTLVTSVTETPLTPAVTGNLLVLCTHWRSKLVFLPFTFPECHWNWLSQDKFTYLLKVSKDSGNSEQELIYAKHTSQVCLFGVAGFKSSSASVYTTETQLILIFLNNVFNGVRNVFSCLLESSIVLFSTGLSITWRPTNESFPISEYVCVFGKEKKLVMKIPLGDNSDSLKN